MSDLTAAEVESGTGGTLAEGPATVVFAHVSIDTRNLRGGDVFFAIRGPNQDGHRYIPEALSKGALGAVAEAQYEYPGEFPPGRVLIKVRDTHEALKELARSVRRRWPGTLVAVTGSMGKTTTREFAAHILTSSFRVYQTPGNYNNLFGLPLALFGLEPEHEFGIFEMGMSAPGEIAEMCRIASPAVGIITNVAPVHLEFFDSLEDIARAKEELAEALPAGGTLIYNADDPLVRGIAQRYAGEKISFGIDGPADVRADRIEITGIDETRFRLSCGGETREAAIPLGGVHYVRNLLPAAALALRFGVPLPRITGSFETLQHALMRGRVLRFKEGFALIDDSYNSNPRALMQMIDALAETPGFARRIVAAGEMLELGTGSKALHYECGSHAAARGIDVVIGVQGAAGEIVRAARESGVPASRAHFFADASSAAEFAAQELTRGDLMLVKGSRAVHMEKIVQALRGKFAVDE